MAGFSLFSWIRGVSRASASVAGAATAVAPHITTHDVHGGGSPRLVVVADDHLHGDVPKMFELRSGVSSIGADQRADICLRGLAQHHADVRRDAADEYVFVHRDPNSRSTINGRDVTHMILHTGDRIMIGDWTLVYSRAESADHGRPHGGRAGGELSAQGHQNAPRPRGTSPQGGSEPTAEDPGEYY
jgi:hypothetical protein